MSNDERFEVTGLGSSRAKALAHAAEQAAQFYGDAPLEAQVGRAFVETMLNDGRPVLFGVNVTYRLVSRIHRGGVG